MADSNLNPAPRNVSAINGAQGIDISGVGQYDENTSLEDIAGSYTNVGKQLGQIVNQAAEHVGDIQTKLVGNDFGGTNPYMYNTYYEPGANEIQSDWRVSGTQKALEVGMERGKKAAEAAAEAAKKNYTDAVNNFNQAVANPTIATLDTSQLGEGNTVDEFIAANDFSGSRDEVMNRYINKGVIDQYGADWSNKKRWKKSANATIKHAGVSQDEYKSWSKEQQDAFWADPKNGTYFSNYFVEDEIKETMGDEALKKYRESYNSVADTINKIYDYYNGITKEIKLEPVKIIQRQYGDVNEKKQIQLLLESLPDMQGFDSDKAVYERASSDEWINQNIRDDKREEFRKWLEQNRQEHTQDAPRGTTFGIATGPIVGTTYYTIDRKALAEFAKDKLVEDAKSLYGANANGTVNVITKEGEAQDTSLRNILGFDIDTLRWYKSMQEEHPETLNIIKNQIAQTYGETSTLEIADGNHYYLINGEYKKPEAGTVVLFAAPGVMDNDGNFINKDYETFVDCFKKLNNAAANYSEEEREKLQKTMQESWTKYYQSIYMLKIAESYTGGVMNEDMYHALMYRVDPEQYKDIKVGDKKVSDIVREWKEGADKDGHGTYVKLTQLLNRAFANNGYYYGLDQNGDLVQYNLKIGDTGVDTVGQVGEEGKENPYANMSPSDAMAIFSIVSTSLQEYQNGKNQDVNINPYFLDDDNVGWFQNFANSGLNMLSTMIDVPASLITMGVGAVGNLFVPEDKRIDPTELKGFSFKNALASLWPENWGKDEWNDLVSGVSAKELYGGTPAKGTLDYQVQFSNLQQQNLADAINPFLVEYWFGKEGDEKNIKRIGEGYTSRTKGLIDLGNASAFDIYGLNTMFANGTAFQESSAKLLGALVGGYVAGYLTTGYKVAATSAMNAVKSGANALANNLRTQILIHSINNTSNETIAQAMGSKILTQTLEQQAAKTSFGGTAALGAGSKAAIAAAAETDKAVVLRGMTDVALRSGSGQLTEGFSTEFLEQSLGNAATGGALSSGVFTAEQAKMFAVAEQQAGKQMAQALAAETIGNATLSLGTGLPAEAFSAMNSATQRMFLKAYNAILNGSATAAGKINVQAFLQSLGTEGIKEAAVEVAKASTEAVARGMVWTNSDTFRVLAQLGWDGASTRMLLTEFMKDAAIDLVRDNLRNATNPYLTNEGWQRQTVEEYFTNPWTYAQNMLYSGVHFGLQRAGAQIKDAYYSKQYDRHLQAYAASGDNPDAQARELVKVNQYINKIQENSNKLMRSGVPYSKMKTSSEAINDDLNYIITKQYEKSGINPVTGEMNKKFTSADEFNEYLKNQKLSTKDRINLANRGMVIETQNNYIMSRYELGGSDKAKLGNIKDWQVNLDMQDIEQKTLDKYYDEVLHMKGTPLDKQRKMYSLYTQEIMAKYGKTIPGLEASLGNYYGKYLSDLEVSLKKNPKAQWTLGYTSLAGMTTLSDDSGDVMFGASFGNNFNTVDRNAADVDKSRAYRDIKRQLLDAIKRGDTELKITRADGKEKTYHLNKDGLNYLKTITAYNNSNTVHKYYDPIFGDSIQTREHKDQVPFAEAAYRSKDTIISGTKIATQAAEADAKAAQEIIDNYTQIAYSRSKATGEDAILAKRHQDIVDANKTLNVADSDHIYKLSQDRAATERYIQELDEQKHGEMQKRYKEVIPMLAEIDGEIGKVEAQREYRQAVSNTKTAISMYLEGKLSSDNPVFTYKYGENESIKITLDDETLGMISEAAKNGQQFSSDLTMMMLVSKRNAVPKKLVARADYAQLIRDLEADTAKTGEDHTATIIKLRKEMKKNNVYHQYPKSANGKKSSAVDYAYKQLEGTDLDTATTGFQIDGKDQLVKYAADNYYYLPSAGQKANPRRAQIVEAATAPIYDFLRSDDGKISVQDERMVAYVVNAAEQNLRNIDTGEENLKITVGTLKREIMKNAPDADIWMAAKKSGATERLANISKLGAQPEAMIAELKTIIASNSNMPVATKNKFLDTVSLYELIAENSSSIKANAYSLNDIVGEGDNATMKGDLIADVQTLTSGMKNADKYEKSELKRMVTSAGYVLNKLSNPNSKYSSALLKKLSAERIDSSNIAKAVKKDFRTLAYDHYTDAIKNPTPQNKAYTDAAFSWAKARYEADPRLSGTSNSDIKVNDVDCMNALGAANHEVMLSAYGDKDNHTYSEYMAAKNNVRDFDLDATNGMFSEQARDFIRLNNATYGQSVEQAEQGINRLINYFPKEKASLLKKQQEYNLEGKRIASQYASSAQIEGRIKAAAGATLEEYGLGTLKTSDINRAMRLAGRLKKAKAEQEALSHRPIIESWFGHSSTSVEPADMRNIPWRRRFLPNGQEDTAATIQSFKQSTAEMNGAVSIADGIEPGVTLDDYKEIVAKARKDLTALYKEAGLAKGRKGKIPAAEIDAFGDKIIESYSTIARANGSGIASDLISLNSAARDNTENAFISAASQAYSDSARATYDAQAEILNKRVKSINRRIKSAEKKAAREAAQQKLGQTMPGKITANVVKANPDKVFLFGDNVEDARTGYVPTSTQAVIRGQENAIGIPTKKNRGTAAASYFTDADFDEFKAGVDDAIAKAKASGKTIVLPENGIGTGAAQLEKRAPKCFKYLQEQLDSLSTSSQLANSVKSDRLHIEPAEKKAAKAAQQKVATAEVVIAPGGSKAAESYANATGGVNVLRKKGTDEHFGNPFSTKNYPGVQKVVGSIDEAVRDYEAWLRGTDFRDIEPERRKWIINQIESGALDGKKLVYYTNDVDGGNYFNSKENPVTKYDADNAPNHAHILAKLVNERGAQTSVDLLRQQLADTEAAIRKHQLLDSEAFARDGKTQFYTDKQILSSEFGRSDLNVKNVYKRGNWPAGLEIGEGNVLYTVNPAEDDADIFKSGSEYQVSSTKLRRYLFDKAAEVRRRFGIYYDDFHLDSRDFEDNGDGTYTISGRYGTGDMTLQEQEERQISRWENLNTSDIDAEKRAILELSTAPIYESYDEMIDLEKYNELLAQHAELSEELYDEDTITTINALRKTAYDQYLQLTNALGKEYLDSLEASKEYQKAISKERKAYKIDDLDEQTIKSNLSREEYDKYIEAKETLFNVARFQMSSDSGIYHAKNGVIFAKDGYNPTGFVDTKIAKAILEGRAVASDDLSDEELAAELNSKENRKARKEMQKDINKNQNKGSIHYKNTEEYKAIRNSAMDKLSARYTLNNYIQFENQTRDMLTGMGLADEYKILMDKDYSDMMQRVAGKDGGIENDGVKAKFFDAMMNTANLNKTIQDWQLAGGFSNYNAATIAQIRGAIFNDPRMALEYLKVFTAAKNSNSTMAYVAESREFLYRFVAKTGAGEYVTDLNQAISTTPGEGDVGTINSLTNRILSHLDGSREVEGKNMISRGFGRIADDMNALFSDATFVNTLPLFKVRMLQINYDEAVRYLKKFKGFENMAANDIDDAAMWMAYAKTTDFLEPRKTRGSSWETFTKNIANEEIRKAVASWTGAKREASLMDNASTVFFALRWKMTFGGRVLNGMTNTPGALIRKLKLRGADITDPDTLTMAGKQFMRSGNTMGVATMIALSSLAMMWNKSLGYDSVSWDDLNIIGPDGEFQVPNILLKFQTLGQFWLPNDVDENGNAIINPTKRMFGLDPFSSIFTMSNTVARTADKLFNPNAYQKTPQRGIIGSQSSNDAINAVVNSSFFKAIGDELVGSNLLSPYKAMYEVIVDDTYFGNNIWEKRKLADGRENPNYDFFRNVVAGVAHIFNFDWMLSGGTNKWVKGFGSDKYENTGKIGTVAGSGVFQHEFVTAAINILNGEALEGIIEAGELPIKTKSISGSARTDFNIRVKNIITQYVQEYKDKVGQLSSVSAKDAEYAKLVQKCADVVADWSAKNQYVLGKDQELVAYVTKTLMAICAGEYNDNLDYVQNAYWKAHDIAKIEQSEDLFLNDSDLETFIAQGKTAAEFAEEKNRRSEAYNQAIDDEYQARIALKNAGIPDSWLEAYEDVYGSRSKSDFKSEMRAVNKQVFAEIHGVLEKQIGEFKNFKEMKKYYEAQIEAASTTKQKAKLANKYNDILTEAIAPYVHKYGAAILSDGYYNNQNLANSIAEYVILPADKYYYGKTPRASYLRDLFHVGYRDNSALPSDKEVYEKYTNALKKVHEGASATAAAMLDRLIRDYKDGRIYISDYDYSRIIRMKAQLNARSKQ